MVEPGECVFIRRDNRVNIVKKHFGDEPFHEIFLNFKRNFLREIYQTFERKDLPLDAAKHKNNVVKLPQRPDIKGLFQSLTPYFESDVEPTDEIMKLKLMEGVYALLRIDERFYPTLFDFAEPWKIDIMEFMNCNYMYDFSLEDLASYTGRSLSTFKRDFKKINDLSPEKWLIRRRLEAAKDMLSNRNKSISDVYVEVGFKNLSHFSHAFKKMYGIVPSSLFHIRSDY